MTKHFIEMHTKSLIEAQDQIRSLNQDDLEVAVLLLSGGLNEKIFVYKEIQEEKGTFNVADFYYVFSLSIQRLALFTQSLGMSDATICHIHESKSLLNMSKGHDAVVQNCREKAYGQDLRLRASMFMSNANFEEVVHMSKKWVASAIMVSQNILKLEKLSSK